MAQTCRAKLDLSVRFEITVKRFRRALGFSQEELAERAGLHRTYVADVGRGACNLSLSSIDKLANALDVSTAALLSHTNDPTNPPRDPRRQLVAGEPVDILLVEDNKVDTDFRLRAFRKGNIANPVDFFSFTKTMPKLDLHWNLLRPRPAAP